MSSVDPLEGTLHSSMTSPAVRSQTDSQDKIYSDSSAIAKTRDDFEQGSITVDQLTTAFAGVSSVVSSIADVDLAFSVDEDISKMVVTVRAVGSDEIIRQFPPEEFLSVAKFIAAQNPDALDEDFLKGLLFDQQA